MTYLEALEKEFDFIYPDLYRALYQNKMLDIVETSENGLNVISPKRRQYPSLLLYVPDFELITIHKIRDFIAHLHDLDDSYKTDCEYLFVPFAMNYSGDYYCFWYRFPADIKANEPLVVLLPHDDVALKVLAKNLEDCIFAQMCQTVCDVREEDFEKDGDFWENIDNMLKTHQPYLSEKHQKIITELYTHQRSDAHKESDDEGKKATKGLIHQEDLDALLEQEIGFEYRGKTYVFEKEDDASLDNLQKIEGVMWLYVSSKAAEDSAVCELLKSLNWRVDKSVSDKLAYHRKISQFTQYSDWEKRKKDILEAFLPRLQKLKTFDGFQLIFKDEQSGQDIELTALI